MLTFCDLVLSQCRLSLRSFKFNMVLFRELLANASFRQHFERHNTQGDGFLIPVLKKCQWKQA